jgi:hypothetical protein
LAAAVSVADPSALAIVSSKSVLAPGPFCFTYSRPAPVDGVGFTSVAVAPALLDGLQRERSGGVLFCLIWGRKWDHGEMMRTRGYIS